MTLNSASYRVKIEKLTYCNVSATWRVSMNRGVDVVLRRRALDCAARVFLLLVYVSRVLYYMRVCVAT